MKKLSLIIAMIWSSCAGFAQIPTKAEWEEVFYNQLTAWSNTFNHFDVDNIHYTYTQNFRVTDYHKPPNDKSWFRYLNTYNDFLFYNKNDQYFIDLLSYVEVHKKGDQYYAMADVDNAIILGSIIDKNTIQVAHCGTPCIFEEVYWLDLNRVIIMGNTEDFNDMNKRIPFIMMVDVSQRSSYHFEVHNTFMKKNVRYEQPKFKKLIWDFDYDEIFGKDSKIEGYELEELK